MTRTEWLESLKPGDLVVESYCGRGACRVEVVRGGYIVTDETDFEYSVHSGKAFDATSNRIRRPTKKEVEDYEHHRMRRRLETALWGALTVPQLRRVEALLDQMEKENEG